MISCAAMTPRHAHRRVLRRGRHRNTVREGNPVAHACDRQRSAICFATLRHQFSYEVTPAESGHAATHFEHACRQVSTCKGHTYAQSSLRSMERYYAPNIKSRHELDRSYPHPLIRST